MFPHSLLACAVTMLALVSAGALANPVDHPATHPVTHPMAHPAQAAHTDCDIPGRSIDLDRHLFGVAANSPPRRMTPEQVSEWRTYIGNMPAQDSGKLTVLEETDGENTLHGVRYGCGVVRSRYRDAGPGGSYPGTSPHVYVTCKSPPGVNLETTSAGCRQVYSMVHHYQHYPAEGGCYRLVRRPWPTGCAYVLHQ